MNLWEFLAAYAVLDCMKSPDNNRRRNSSYSLDDGNGVEDGTYDGDNMEDYCDSYGDCCCGGDEDDDEVNDFNW